VVLHHLAGLRRRSLGVSPSYRTVADAEDSRACCIPLPILGFHAFPLGAIW